MSPGNRRPAHRGGAAGRGRECSRPAAALIAPALQILVWRCRPVDGAGARSGEPVEGETGRGLGRDPDALVAIGRECNRVVGVGEGGGEGHGDDRAGIGDGIGPGLGRGAPFDLGG